ncbi:hypothetical protein [Candidatus Symbiobacter mobilis]|uniref:Uncharacterized protein n=1 Tax=Candidatus Symbiobacter mobilis CR TaxID=946483 RepID=U5NAY0_9BURK|nr:hypothetical protein [Candidatus Symbiobacter mobilis]AGX88736.1 hypothetical protein Cenrod_2686 [Candidatus Symbiobacter mobilis CR]
MPSNETLVYRTKSNAIDYKFQFVTTPNGTERAYIVSQPSYQGRPTDAHSTHRYYDSARDQHYICFDPEPRSRDTIKKIASQWAENTESFRREGKRF